MTSSAVPLRSATGFSATNMKPPLRWPPPVNATTLSTPGSAFTMSSKCVSFSCIAWKEMLWSPTRLPWRRPVSCWGMKLLGTMIQK